jgi:uncharacterized protein (DUF779 family)
MSDRPISEILAKNCKGNCENGQCPKCYPTDLVIPASGFLGTIADIPVTGGFVTAADEMDEEEDTDAYDAFELLSPYEKWQHDALLRVMGENRALVEEVRACRTDIADLRAYVGELETRAQEMASPEKMQEAMNKMMGGMLG